jgi:hypothetical protein
MNRSEGGFPEQSSFQEVTKAHVTRTAVCPSSIVMIIFT